MPPDRKPRALYRPAPVLTDALKKRTPARVVLLFVVDEHGRVRRPVVQSSSDESFDEAALHAVSRWRFEPGRRNGKVVPTRLRVPIQFPHR